ncbi:MAG TPA: PfkB family carbohydrate kinase [Gaiellaceae bacterium]|nr:PfkB family carbohydrate kinase [Gaiellaceae bacterium]
MRGVAVIGNLTRDVVDGGPPRVGGTPFHAARALRLLGGRTRIVARCTQADRRSLLPPLVALGVPVVWLPADSTASFELRYSGEERATTLVDPGAPWTLPDALHVGRAAWVQVGSLARGDVPAEVLEALARDRRIALDGQGLLRLPQPGPASLDAEFSRDLLRHVHVLKLSTEEAEALGGEAEAAGLGVPEVVVTHGPRGAVLLTPGHRDVVPVRRVAGVDPTGAGDAFLAAYVWARACGHRPLSAARHAAGTAARVLELAAVPA